MSAASEGPRVLETLHSGFTVADVRATAQLLCECFGFTATEPHCPPSSTLSRIVGLTDAQAEIIHVTTPGHHIELLQYHSPAGRSDFRLRPCDTGFSHIAFRVSDVGAMAARASMHGFSVLADIPRITTGRSAGRRATYVRDRHGFTIELMGP
jgi:catechol 2,3-dioxygenase-like lactoylglutathione lyase family enzyme